MQINRWIVQLEAMAWEYRRVLLAHRDAALVLANTPPVGPNRLGLAERMLTVLVRSGISPDVAAKAGLLFVDYVTNAVIQEGPVQAMMHAFGSEAERATSRDVRGWIAILPADQYPTLVALAADLTDTDPEARFRFGSTCSLLACSPRGDDLRAPMPQDVRRNAGAQRCPYQPSRAHSMLGDAALHVRVQIGFSRHANG